MPGPLTRTIAATLRDAFERRGMTQTQIAALIEQSQSQVSKYLRGDVPLDVEELDQMCRILGISIVDVVNIANEATRSRLHSS